jgi:CheY-like chemotaxis protein
MLGRLGYHADAVAHGREALTALTQLPYDLVLMDCQMPVMDGYEATRAIRAPNSPAMNPRVPIIAMTANALIGDRELCLDAGMNDYLTKPVALKALAETIGRHLQGASPRNPPPADIAWTEFVERVGGDATLAAELLTEFSTEIQGHRDRLAAAAEHETTAQLLHRLGALGRAASNFCAPGLRTACAEAEQALRHGQPPTLALTSLDRHVTACRTTIAALTSATPHPGSS